MSNLAFTFFKIKERYFLAEKENSFFDLSVM